MIIHDSVSPWSPTELKSTWLIERVLTRSYFICFIYVYNASRSSELLRETTWLCLFANCLNLETNVNFYAAKYEYIIHIYI